nr:hypothetical protein [Bacillus massiliigorillae]
MYLLLWLTIGFIITGFVVLIFIKRNMESKKSATTQSIVWWIIGNIAWGVVSIILIVWCFNTIY